MMTDKNKPLKKVLIPKKEAQCPQCGYNVNVTNWFELERKETLAEERARVDKIIDDMPNSIEFENKARNLGLDDIDIRDEINLRKEFVEELKQKLNQKFGVKHSSKTQKRFDASKSKILNVSKGLEVFKK